MRQLPFIQLDVFTSTALQGNQLAVFPDARGVTDEQMQALARETNFSETTFVLPRDPGVERERGVRVRIFTVAEELPFAGHPTLGTAWHLCRARGCHGVTLDLNVGPVKVTFDGEMGEMVQRDPVFGELHAHAAIAPLGGLDVTDLRADVPVGTVSTGLPFIVVPVRSVAALGRLVFNAPAAAAYLDKRDAKFLYWVCLDAARSGVDARARMLFYGGEDPATGSAAGCAISHLVRHGVVAPGRRIVIEQGVEMKRASLIHARAELRDGHVTGVGIGGHVVQVAQGEYVLP